MSDQPESLQVSIEEYKGDSIDRVFVKRDEINIYLKNGKYISVTSTLDISCHGILPKLGVTRAFWGQIGGV